MEEKTNVMRILDQKKLSYQSHCYVGTGAVSWSGDCEAAKPAARIRCLKRWLLWESRAGIMCSLSPLKKSWI